MMPPCFTAASSAAKVQLAGVPVPTTLVGCEVSTGWAWLGRAKVVQEPSGFPAGGSVAAPASVIPPSGFPAGGNVAAPASVIPPSGLADCASTNPTVHALANVRSKAHVEQRM